MASNHIQSPSGTAPIRIQSIFNETISKIINLVEQEPSTTATTDTANTGDEPVKMTKQLPKDKQKISADLIPILQTFLMNIQIYHTATFNGIINGISAVVPGQSLITCGDISQPSVSHKWQTQHSVDTSNSNINVQENVLAGFAAMELNDTSTTNGTFNVADTRPISLVGKGMSEYQPRSAASQETRRFWEKDGQIPRQTFNSPPTSYVSSNQSNYDDFLKHYTDEFAKYHNTYVDDSSEAENEDSWQSLSEYVSERTYPEPEQPSDLGTLIKSGVEAQQCGGTTSTGLFAQPVGNSFSLNGTQCCARLSKYMKYRIADLSDDFVKSYPPDTYIEGGFVFGKPCLNYISSETEDKGGFFCHEHINDAGVEDIRQPRPDITYDRDNGKDDNLEIVFSNEGYKASASSSYEKPSTSDWEGFDYYGEYDPNYSTARQINRHGGNDAFSKNHQCCARLNKFRLYRLELESTNFLNTYPNDVYIEDGCVYGTACQNLISDESYSAGIRFCIEHESDPYVDNICEPMIINSKLTKQRPQNTSCQQTFQNQIKKSNSDMAETENIPNDVSTSAVRRSSRLNQTGSYEWDKYNTDFNYLC